MKLQELLKSQKTIVCVGSGGVGKTTTSAALGLMAADLGLKVVILTVDPAQRLATTLKLTANMQAEALVSKTEGGGELWASLVQPRIIFDEFIRNCAPNPHAAERLIKNSLYEQLATRLSGSQEFTSLEKLYQLKQKKYFDLIILDTPPAQNAGDFLQAPTRLLNLFDDSITRWFIGGTEQPSLWRSLISMGTMRALKSLEVLTGSRFVQDLVDFFSSMREFQSQLRDHAQLVRDELKHTHTGFILITGFDVAKLSEAENATVELKSAGFGLSAVIINRARPLWLPDKQDFAENFESLPAEWVELYQKTKAYYQDRLQEYGQFAERQNKKCKVFVVPQFIEESIAGLPGLRQLYKAIEEGTKIAHTKNSN